MNSLATELVYGLMCDLAHKLGATDHLRDFRTVTKRVKNEGDSFLTITLPSYSQIFERCLESGRVGPHSFLGWKKAKGSVCIPAFLQEYMSNVFHANGEILEEVCVQSIYAIRQICLFAKKVELDCTEDRKVKSVQAFLKVEEEIDNQRVTPIDWHFKKVCDLITSSLIPDDSWYDCIKPQHGSGATSNRAFGNNKWLVTTWPTNLEYIFPYSEFGIGSLNNYQSFDHIDFPPSEESEPAKLSLVPKTLKTPRIIAVEPSWNQFIQQGLMRYLVPRIETGKYTGGRVNFRDQSVNQKLAESSSKDRKFATLDLSEASDRVSLQHVKTLLNVNPFFLEGVLACRSSRLKLPNGEVLPLKKFASMGSAMCFPIEALVFFCTIAATRLYTRNQAVTPRTLKQACDGVYVYGDDIIVPTDEVASIVWGLESNGFKVNSNKSFWNSSFRESCGGDFYGGRSVKPVYLRNLVPDDRRSASRIISCISTANQLFDAGLYRTARYLKESIEELMGKLPTIPRDSQVLGFHEFSTHEPRSRFNSELHRREKLVYVARVKHDKCEISDDSALAKCFRMIGSSEYDEKHLTRDVRPRDLAISRKWVAF